MINNSEVTLIMIKRNKIFNIIQGESIKNEKLNIPPEGRIIIASGDARKMVSDYKVGSQIDINNKFHPDWNQKKLVSIIQSGPNLLTEGKINITSEKEKIRVFGFFEQVLRVIGKEI